MKELPELQPLKNKQCEKFLPQGSSLQPLDYVTNGSPLLRYFFKTSGVAPAQWRKNRPCQLVTRLMLYSEYNENF